jgi:hypothetical protein
VQATQGHRLLERCPPELFVRWLQLGCFTPLMHAHSRMAQEPWRYGARVQALYRAYVLLHEQLVPYVRAAARTAAATGLPIIRPLCLTAPGDPRGWTIADAYGYGPALWVAPVLEAGAREREVPLPEGGWIETWSGRRITGGQEVAARAHGGAAGRRDADRLAPWPLGAARSAGDHRRAEVTRAGAGGSATSRIVSRRCTSPRSPRCSSECSAA